MQPTPDDDPRIATADDWAEDSPERRAFRQFAALTRTKRELERKLDEAKDQLDALAYQLRDYLGTGGYERVRVDGCTIYLRRQVFARKYDWASTAEVCAALKANGMAHFVKEAYNSQSLSKHVRELEESHQAELDSGEMFSVSELLPPPVARVLNIEPSYAVIAMEVE